MSYSVTNVKGWAVISKQVAIESTEHDCLHTGKGSYALRTREEKTCTTKITVWTKKNVWVTTLFVPSTIEQAY